MRATVGRVLADCRDWLDARGRIAWLVAMILGFVAAWPVGLFILGYMIWSKRMFGSCTHRRHRDDEAQRSYRAAPTGNAAFDAYRDETLKRLEGDGLAIAGLILGWLVFGVLCVLTGMAIERLRRAIPAQREPLNESTRLELEEDVAV